jgi:hypothetical protein
MVLFGTLWSILIPPFAAALPVALLARRMPETFQQPRSQLRRQYIFVVLLGLAVLCWFALGSRDFSFPVELIRAVLTTVAILLSASLLAARFPQTRFDGWANVRFPPSADVQGSSTSGDRRHSSELRHAKGPLAVFV